jgi:hypothetical protein
VARLSAALATGRDLVDRLLAVSKKLAAGEKLADGSEEMLVLYRGLSFSEPSFGGDMAGRTLVLVRKLPPEQRGKLLGDALCNFSIPAHVRTRFIDELALIGDEPSTAALLRAAELELALPPATFGSAGTGNYLVPRLADKLAKAGNKTAVDLTIQSLENQLANLSANNKDWGVSLYAESATLAERLGTWSGQEGWSQLLKRSKDGRFPSIRIKGDKDIEQARAELEKIKAWWKENRADFKFPKEEPKPPAPPLQPMPRPEQPKPPAPEQF